MADETVFRFITQSQGGGAAPGGPGGSPGAAPSPGPAPANAGAGGSPAHAPSPIPTPPAAPAVGVTPPPVIAPKPPPPPVTPPPVIPAAGGGAGFGAGVSAVGQGTGFASMGAGQLAGGLAASLGVALPAIAAFAGALYIAKSAIETTFAAIGNATQQARPYSGALINAQANNELRQIFADIKTAQTLGGPLAEYESATGEMSRAIQEIRDAFLGEVLRVGLPVMQVIAEILTAMAEKSGALTDAAKSLLQVQFPALYNAVTGLSDIAAYFAAKKEKEPDLTDPVFFFDTLQWPSETNPVGEGGVKAGGGKVTGGFHGQDLSVPDVYTFDSSRQGLLR